MLRSDYFQFRARYWPFALVLTCGLLLGYFAVRIFVAPSPRQYQLDFGEAKWIEPPKPSPVAYFRQKIFLSSAPEQAWLEVAATDSFTLLVNDRSVGSEKSLKTRVAGIYDIKARLTPGVNVIGVEVNRSSFPGSAQGLIYGMIKEPGHASSRIISDEAWKVTTYTGITGGYEPWSSPLTRDDLWPNSRVVAIERSVPMNWVKADPLLFSLPSAGRWILARDARRQAIFSTTINASKLHQETWIQVASSGDLDLLVNGKLVTTASAVPLKDAQSPRILPSTVLPPKPSQEPPPSDASTASAPPVSTLAPPSLDAYDISRWIKKGSNQIIAAIRSDTYPAMFLAEGFLVGKGGNPVRFQTDSSKWRVLGLSSKQQAAKSEEPVEAGNNGAAPWGYLRQGIVKQPNLTDFGDVVLAATIIFLVALATILMWLLASWIAAQANAEPIRSALVRDALFHAPITLALSFLLFLGYDYRLPDNWAFQPRFFTGAILSLIAIHLFHFGVRRHRKRAKSLFRSLAKFPVAKALPYLLFAAIVGLGFALRYHSLGFISFDHDEMGIITKSKGVFQRGYPYNEIRGVIKPVGTYELIPYSVAISGKIFGYSEWSTRLPSCLCGTLTIAVIIVMGRRLFNWRTGLISGLIYACLTLNIRWAQNAFYLQQCQLAAMLTFWFFYEAISVRPLSRIWLTAASVSFAATYLSWEGSGFVLPALFASLVVVRWGEWWWLKERHIYVCLFFLAALVIAQYCWRTLGGNPYLMIGSGLSNLSGPSLFFLKHGYSPTFYLDELFFAESHVLFTVMLLLAIPFCWRHRGFRYVVTLLASFLIIYTNFLGALSPRYCYFYQPLLLLGAVAGAVMLYDRLIALAWREGNSLLARSFAHATGLGLIVLLFLQSNDWLVKAYSFSAEGDAPGQMSRMNTYRYDYRGAAYYVRDHWQPGDIVIPLISHVFENYTGRPGDYYLDTLYAKRVSYSDRLDEPALIEKFRGNPVIRSVTELQEVTHRGRRTWIVFVPFGGFKKASSPAVLDYLEKNSKTVFESYRAKVFLIEGANQPASVVGSSNG